ncbi:MAG: adaptor protein MecA [Eubacterium sp.]|nr:adaptor protein MecA [Eubacterium sp.]
MKIEKINDNQIRCTLTKEDLMDRQLKLSELAYGTQKAKDLFADMMREAQYQFGFDAQETPIMIEAIPLSSECILLVITKVENPDELDARFSRFSTVEEEPDSEIDNSINQSANDILDMFAKLRNGEVPEEEPADFVPLSRSLAGKEPKVKKPKAPARAKAPAAVVTDITKLYSFDTLLDVTRAAEVVKGFYKGENTLYHNNGDHRYYLFMKKSDHSPQDYNKLCNIFSEYAHQETCTPAIEAYYKEHEKLVIGRKALQVLTEL